MRPPFYSRDSRNRTGCHGVSKVTAHVRRKRGVVTRRYYQAYAFGSTRRFRIDTLGEREAFRRAVALRARWERTVISNQKEKVISAGPTKNQEQGTKNAHL